MNQGWRRIRPASEGRECHWCRHVLLGIPRRSCMRRGRLRASGHIGSHPGKCPVLRLMECSCAGRHCRYQSPRRCRNCRRSGPRRRQDRTNQAYRWRCHQECSNRFQRILRRYPRHREGWRWDQHSSSGHPQLQAGRGVRSHIHGWVYMPARRAHTSDPDRCRRPHLGLRCRQLPRRWFPCRQFRCRQCPYRWHPHQVCRCLAPSYRSQSCRRLGHRCRYRKPAHPFGVPCRAAETGPFRCPSAGLRQRPELAAWRRPPAAVGSCRGEVDSHRRPNSCRAHSRHLSHCITECRCSHRHLSRPMRFRECMLWR